MMSTMNLQNVIDDKDWIADRMINPQKYNEKHSSIVSYKLYETSSNENDEATTSSNENDEAT